MKLLAIAFVFLLLSSTAYAADNSQWCGLMTAIYGICSPQLVDNYLAMTKNPPKPPNTIKASVQPITTPATLVKEAVTGDSPPSLSQQEVGHVLNVSAPPLKLKYRYYWSNIWQMWLNISSVYT